MPPLLDVTRLAKRFPMRRRAFGRGAPSFLLGDDSPISVPANA
jgi:hypothetical protein